MRYFKQYGCKRTGTNYLKALLERNFSDVMVLMHTLGGKHNRLKDPCVAGSIPAYTTESKSLLVLIKEAFLHM